MNLIRYHLRRPLAVCRLGAAAKRASPKNDPAQVEGLSRDGIDCDRMGRRLQARGRGSEARALTRLTLSYLAVFGAIIVVLSVVAYAFLESEYRSVLGPALDTPEVGAGLSVALRRALVSIVLVDALLLLVVGAAAYALARSALRPLVAAREREERFSADAAHELRTPLGTIASVAQEAREHAGENERRAFDTIARRALEAGALVSDLLTLARASGTDALLSEPVDVAAIVARTLHDVRAETDRTFEVSLHGAIVMGDERRLAQLVRNLLANAAGHARAGVTCSVTSENGRAILVVDDDGPGVEPALVPRLFERFSKSKTSKGTGLGLAICRWIARAHGGDIVFEGGARFVVWLPLARNENES